MGLAPYGQPGYADKLRQLVQPKGGLFELDLRYFTHHTRGVEMTWADGSPTIGRIFSHELEELLGPARQPDEPIETHHEDVARSLQEVLEETYLHLVTTLWERTGIPRLALAGGVALNAVANGRIIPETPAGPALRRVVTREGYSIREARRQPEHAEAVKAFLEKREPNFSR